MSIETKAEELANQVIVKQAVRAAVTTTFQKDAISSKATKALIGAGIGAAGGGAAGYFTGDEKKKNKRKRMIIGILSGALAGGAAGYGKGVLDDQEVGAIPGAGDPKFDAAPDSASLWDTPVVDMIQGGAGKYGTATGIAAAKRIYDAKVHDLDPIPRGRAKVFMVALAEGDPTALKALEKVRADAAALPGGAPLTGIAKAHADLKDRAGRAMSRNSGDKTPAQLDRAKQLLNETDAMKKLIPEPVTVPARTTGRHIATDIDARTKELNTNVSNAKKLKKIMPKLKRFIGRGKGTKALRSGKLQMDKYERSNAIKEYSDLKAPKIKAGPLASMGSHVLRNLPLYLMGGTFLRDVAGPSAMDWAAQHMEDR